MSDFDTNGKFAKGNRFSFANRPDAINPNGRPKGRSIQDHLRKMLEDDVTGEQLCDALVKSAIDRALKGDFRFWQEIIQRVDGKVPNRLADADGSSLTFILDEAVQSMNDKSG
jgi:hypothetical protein